jgi:hypothetical protein
MSDLGPQKGPSSIAKIQAESKYLVKLLDDMCGGCKTCCCKNGGYQAHVTVDGPREKILQIIGDVELVEITNFYGLSWYTEFITSENFKTYNEALHGLTEIAAKLMVGGLEVVRLKIESNPQNKDLFYYREIHYKVSFGELCRIHNVIPVEDSGKYFISMNSKNSYFLTRRFFDDSPIDFLDFPYRMEDVILDSNIEVDNRLSGYKG